LPPPTGARSCAPVPAYPTTACTGITPGTALATVNGSVTLSTPGQVYENKLVTGGISVTAANVTIRNVRVYTGVWNRGGSFTLSDSEIGANSGCDGNAAVGPDHFTATRVYIHNFSDGFRDSGDNILVADSFVKLCSNAGDHSDGFQGYQGGSNVVMRHNTLDQRAAAPDVTSPIFIADGSKGIVAQNNLLAGGGYTIRMYGSGFTASGNRIVNGSWMFGPNSSDCAGINWSDNRLVTIDASYNVTSLGANITCP
jgi:hypothetical protein